MEQPLSYVHKQETLSSTSIVLVWVLQGIDAKMGLDEQEIYWGNCH